jgi:hypothetical protein
MSKISHLGTFEILKSLNAAVDFYSTNTWRGSFSNKVYNIK